MFARPDFSRPFVVQSDASDLAFGAVLTQEDEDGREHPIVYVSRVLNPAERNYTTTEKECLALLWAIKKLRPYLEGYRFTAVTDHSPLKWLKNLKEPTVRLDRWALEMQQWDFEIVHKRGAIHYVPDALSHGVPSEGKKVAAFDAITDPWYLARVKDVQTTPKKFPNWRIEDGMLYCFTSDQLLDPVLSQEENWRLVVPIERRARVMQDSHCHPSSGHLGVEKTYDRVAREYYWPGVYHDV